MRSIRFRILFAATAAILSACGSRVEPVYEVVAFEADEAPLDPGAALWEQVPAFRASLRAQDLVEPRLLEESTSEVLVQALTNGVDVSFRLEWRDPAVDDRPGPARFLDGCAIQIPRQLRPEPPDAQMGQEDGPVDIAFWRADWQAAVDGRGDSIRDLYPNATVDHYPFEAPSLEGGSAARAEMAKRYSPAAAVGNRRAGPRESPVESLAAYGPGTLRPHPGLATSGLGERIEDGWAVVIRRPLPAGLTPENRAQIAFAVWEGSHGEAGSRKMITGWNPLAIRRSE